MFNFFRKKMPITYSYDDVTLVPAYSSLTSRSQANPQMHGYKLPIISSCMDTLGTVELLKCCVSNKIPYIIHRTFKTVQKQFYSFFENDGDWIKNYSDEQRNCIWFAVGSVQKYSQWIDWLMQKGVRRFCVDMAHGDSKTCIDTIQYIKLRFSNDSSISYQKPHIIAGNVASVEGFRRLQKAGADGVRIGVASGQICFLPGTKVSCVFQDHFIMKNIQDIKIGDKVISKGGLLKQISKTYQKDYSGQVYTIKYENQTITCTPQHKFLVYNYQESKEEWVPIKDIHMSKHAFINVEKRLCSNGLQISIDEYSGKVYNIEVDQEHNYCVGNSKFITKNCSTALQTGFGVPILSNLMDIYPYKKNTWMIADGGAKYAGDIAKAVYFGADFVMMGKMFASTDLAAGRCYNKNKELLSIDKAKTEQQKQFCIVYPHEFQEKYKNAQKIDWSNSDENNTCKNMCLNNIVAYKQYHGLASREARRNVMSYASVQGVSGLTKYTSSTEQFINDTFLRLQASLSYGGAKTWNQFKRNVKACMRSNAGIIAADTHLQVTTDR